MTVRRLAASAMTGKSFLPRRYSRSISQSASGLKMIGSVSPAKKLLRNLVPVKNVVAPLSSLANVPMGDLANPPQGIISLGPHCRQGTDTRLDVLGFVHPVVLAFCLLFLTCKFSQRS